LIATSCGSPHLVLGLSCSVRALAVRMMRRGWGAALLLLLTTMLQRKGRWPLLAAGATAGLLLASRRAGRLEDLRGQSALVTGGSRGLGLMLGRELIASGVSALAICGRDEAALERARQDLTKSGARVLAIRADVTDQGQVENLVQTVAAEFGRLDILINNAGTIAVGPLDAMTVADFEDALRTNFWGPLHATLAALPVMRRQRGGRIVNIASIGGKISVPHLVPYAASKFALVGLSQGLRAELAREGIVVTTVCPGLMRTGSPRNADFKGHHRAEYAWFSVSDSLPGLSMDARRAARQIVRACRRGDAEIVLSLPAKAAVTLQCLVPSLVNGVLQLANRALPGPGGVGRARVKGRDSESFVSPSILTVLGDSAAHKFNQI
jgi:NAD(P)-dependent dehydrogenase (short-subunit alcohol dehydrogenase family)